MGVGSHRTWVVIRASAHGGTASITAAITTIATKVATIASVATAVAEVLLAQGSEPLLLGHGVDVRADDEGDDVEEGDPRGLGQELLGEGEAQGRGDPGDLHDLHEADADCGADLMVGASARNEGHGHQVDGVLDRGDDEVADNDLHDLGLQAGSALEGLLQTPDQEVAQRRTDQSTVRSHLGHSGGEVVAMLVAVFGEERGNQLLQTGQSTSREHLGAKRVLFELVDVGL